MNVPSQSQINAGIRYASGYVVTIGAVAVAAGALPPDKIHAIVDAFQKLFTDLQNTIGDFYLIATLVGPIIMTVIARFGVKSASPKSQIASVQALPTAQVTVSDPKLATAGVKVVDKLP